jgi:hypothetical protein
MIDKVCNLYSCPKLVRIFLSNNQIAKLDNMRAIKEIPQLLEIGLDGNAVTNVDGYFKLLIHCCPNLKTLDMTKVTKEMIESNGPPLSDKDKAKTLPENGDGNRGSDATTDLSNIASNTTDKAPQPTTEEINAENLMKVISKEWDNEFDRIKSLGLNGYKRRKESKNESLVQSGHAEIEGNQILFVYGNALEVLNNAEFQKTVE